MAVIGDEKAVGAEARCYRDAGATEVVFSGTEIAGEADRRRAPGCSSAGRPSESIGPADRLREAVEQHDRCPSGITGAGRGLGRGSVSGRRLFREATSLDGQEPRP
ncbi:hypothetical protein GCM10014715_09760 [Streptomyces spiralis]|uniref:Uncharacterized protein n=1 Tax=Streptomyces spiralis TaxID=66376 RepID=A0A918ZN57_9ACTN|nr:hypothetical protein GCM10014715_09760 [Streptomyces spiralis]